jgi:hypothetical protein
MFLTSQWTRRRLRPVFTYGPQGPGPRATNFRGWLIKKFEIEVWYAEKKGCPREGNLREIYTENNVGTTARLSFLVTTLLALVQWTLELRQTWHKNNLGNDQNFSFDLRPKSWVMTRMPVKAIWITTRTAFVSFIPITDTRVCGRNSGQCIALHN